MLSGAEVIAWSLRLGAYSFSPYSSWFKLKDAGQEEGGHSSDVVQAGTAASRAHLLYAAACLGIGWTSSSLSFQLRQVVRRSRR